jgi:hypothetical protein
MRKESASGQFYPSDKKELEMNINSLLKGAGKPLNAIGIVAPHAGYVYSGKAAAFSYNAISKERFDTFIIIGPNHSARSKIAVSNEDFQTPLGVAESDKEFCNEIIREYGVNNFAHLYEHSLEVQMPFLLSVFKNVRIVPITISSDKYEECLKLAESIFNASKKLRRKICVIASSDFTHYGPAYGYLPFSGNKAMIKGKIKRMDYKAIKLIKELKGKEFFEISKTMTVCGNSAIAVTIELCKKMGSKKAKLLKYYTSGDILGNYENSVSYASLAFL